LSYESSCQHHWCVNIFIVVNFTCYVVSDSTDLWSHEHSVHYVVCSTIVCEVADNT